ncbi:HD domain-containing protein [Treponema zuelzerae]|uniref:HD domain-containing protein n=1 Tax=Teretinema zuelzerae TaxID=156 RepID=A0AAE3EGP8_9SPIR|nr:HD domain-containing phosphohydrolase [Teretinema zuelzerae]MBN2811872.1 HD domain-containing protein [Spirochaetales bacterium]MCD1653273.1 HD domain-containing protein [Teretinema zuelzerae]
MGYIKKSREEILSGIIETEAHLNKIQDVDVLMEQILTEARKVVHADAGSIYVRDGDRLAIHYAQNDTLQKQLPPGQKILYSYFSFPINEKTIAGYSALTKQLVNEPDVYVIDPDKPYKFGRQSDAVSGYRTRSNLTIPLTTSGGAILGVLQVLNAIDESGEVSHFDKDDELYISHFAANATVALEHAHLTRSMVLRMIRMSELRDPKETGPHVNRVSSYAVEIYDRWAFNHQIDENESRKFRDTLKIASMLHDVGKVAISDLILKKPARFTPDEYHIMQGHTWLGAKLFSEIESPVDRVAREVALTHHENWDGTGYPGHVVVDTGEPIKVDSETGKAIGLKGREIPIAGRIVALADVYDALSCKRVYKEPWNEENVLEEIRKMSGNKFDPEVVSAFFEILPSIQSIKERFPDQE